MKSIDIHATFYGRDGEATKRMYAELEKFGPVGQVAINLLRASKTSEAAKRYRGGDKHGSFKAQAYARKQWSMENLADTLYKHGLELGIPWGWAIDRKQEYHQWVLYVQLATGQVSFHTSARGVGPDYLDPWDGVRGVSASRILSWVATVTGEKDAVEIKGEQRA